MVECVRIYTGVAAKAKGQKKAEAVKELGEVKAELSGLTSRLQKKVLQAKRLKIFQEGQEALLQLPIEEYKARLKYEDLSALSLKDVLLKYAVAKDVRQVVAQNQCEE